jgi:succinyl-CoA synthetase beta subunit
MNLHEYQAKQVFAEYGLPVSIGIAVDTADEAVAATKKLGGDTWVIKAQVHAGGRGKAGGVKLVTSEAEVREFWRRAHQAAMPEANGRPVQEAVLQLRPGWPRVIGMPEQGK